jgi:hypothetical protein
VDVDGAPDDQLVARIWGEVLWEAVVASAGVDRPAEREAAIQIASSLMRRVALHLALAESYIVLVVRDAEMHGAVGQDHLLVLALGLRVHELHATSER